LKNPDSGVYDVGMDWLGSVAKAVLDALFGPRGAVVSAVLVVFGLPFLLTSYGFFPSSDLPDVPTQFVWIPFAAFWLGASVLLVALVKWAGTDAAALVRRYSKRRKVRKYLLWMPEDQLKIVMSYVSQQRNSLPWSIHSGAIRDLEKRGVVYQATNALSPIGTFAFVVDPDVQDFFRPRVFDKILAERTKIDTRRER
jgi:hypothetical protein